MHAEAFSARDVIMHMLRARFGMPAAHRIADGLSGFQQEGLDRIRDIVQRYRGALLADSVGLGKTMVARALILEEVRAGGRVLVTAPAQLETHWRRHLRGVRRWEWMSHTALSRRGDDVQPAWSLVVADEAHAFRNPGTRRYAALAAICADARVLLVTATPVNNSIYDFYHLVRLFADDCAFAPAGVPDLAAAAAAAAFGAGVELRRVAECVVVRRTRTVIASTAAADSNPAFRFPRTGPVELLRYDLESSYPGMLRMLTGMLASLRFPAHGNAAAQAGIREILRLNLLKRLESSSAAFRTSLERHASALRLFIDAAAAGRLFVAGRDADVLAAYVSRGQTALRDLTLPPWPRDRMRAAEIRIAGSDLARMEEVRLALADLSADAKAEALHHTLLHGTGDDRVLLFTEYRDTAIALWQRLAALGGVALVHGNDARLGTTRSSRSAVIERFAPLSNGAKLPAAHQRVRLLIATDLLAEGMNLQDARVVISYDLPWNPVRLAQRIGRIDRLGSPHATVRAIAFRPDRGVDELLRLMQRIREKLRAARIVGSDTPRLRASNGGPVREPGRQRLLGLADMDEVELLRARLRAASPEPFTSLPERTVAACCRDGPPAAIWCIRQRGTAWLVLVEHGRRPQVGSRVLHRMLLDELDHPADASCIAACAVWEVDSLRRALRAVRRIGRKRRSGASVVDRRFQRGLVFPVTGPSPGLQALRDWLRARPGGVADDDLAEADQWLEDLRRGARDASLSGRSRLQHQELHVVAGLLLVPPGGLPPRVDDPAAADYRSRLNDPA